MAFLVAVFYDKETYIDVYTMLNSFFATSGIALIIDLLNRYLFKIYWPFLTILGLILGIQNRVALPSNPAKIIYVSVLLFSLLQSSQIMQY